MSFPIKESDWKKFRELSETALDRAFDRALAHIEAIQSTNQTSRQKFWDIKNYADQQRKLLAQIFDGKSRSNAIDRLAMMQMEKLLTDEEIASFSDETREFADRLIRFYRRDFAS